MTLSYVERDQVQPKKKKNHFSSPFSPLLCDFPDFPDRCLEGDKPGESLRPLLGRDISGES